MTWGRQAEPAVACPGPGPSPPRVALICAGGGGTPGGSAVQVGVLRPLVCPVPAWRSRVAGLGAARGACRSPSGFSAVEGHGCCLLLVTLVSAGSAGLFLLLLLQPLIGARWGVRRFPAPRPECVRNEALRSEARGCGSVFVRPGLGVPWPWPPGPPSPGAGWGLLLSLHLLGAWRGRGGQSLAHRRSPSGG